MLRGALERDGRQMSTSAVEADSEMERDSGLTADESLRRGAWGASGPPRAGFEAWRPGGRTPMVVDLVGSGGAESRVRSVAVVMIHEDGKHALQVSFVHDQHPVQTLGADCAHESLRDPIACGTRNGVRTIWTPSLWNTSSKLWANF